MENAIEALKMAFAFLVFVMALTVSIITFGNVKKTADVVLYAKDETNYYKYIKDSEITGKAAENRIVGLETIIPTLYKYYKENYTVVFREANYNTSTGEFSEAKPLPIYITNSNAKTSAGVQLWGKNYDTIMQNKYSKYFSGGYTESLSKNIFSFDLEEETLRHEPWTGNYEKTKENLDCFLKGDIYYNPNLYNPNLSANGNKGAIYIDYKKAPLQTGGFIGKYKSAKFVETVGEYEYSSSQASDTEDGSSIDNSLIKSKKKRIIIFTLIK